MLGAGGTCEFSARSECRHPSFTSVTGFCACLRSGCSSFRNHMQTMMVRGAARAREPALLAERSQDGEVRAASSERSPGWAQRASGDGHGQPRASGKPGIHRLKTCATRGPEPRERLWMSHARSSVGRLGGADGISRSQPAGASLRSRAARQTGWPASRVRRSKCVR